MDQYYPLPKLSDGESTIVIIGYNKIIDEVIFVSDGFVMTAQIISNIPLVYTMEKIIRELIK